ncbi:MAG: ester cyclase [Tahibacter sp.]
MSSTHRSLAIRWMEEVWNRRRIETVDELMAVDAVGHMEGAEVHGREAFKAARAQLLGAFPDLRVSIEDTAADGDHVVVRWTVNAHHAGDDLGIAATHAPVSFRGLTWLRFSQGQIVEGWDCWNQGGLLQRLQSCPDASVATGVT